MGKEVGLEKCHSEIEERERNSLASPFKLAGGIVVCLDGYNAILTAYLATTNLYQYKDGKNKVFLYVGAFTAITAVLSTVLFFLRGSNIY